MLLNYVPNNLHTHYSFLRSLIKPDKIVDTLANYGMGSCCITDFDILSGTVNFYTSCKKQGIKPILGIKVFTKYRELTGYVTLIAMNKEGWNELITLSSLGYTSDKYTDRPTVDLEDVAKTKNCAVLVGSQESILYSSIYGNTPSYSNPIIDNSLANQSRELIEYLKSAFKEMLFFQVERVTQNPSSLLAADIISERARLYGIKCIASDNTLYVNEFDKSDHTMITAANLKCSVYDLPTRTASLDANIFSQLDKYNFCLRNPVDFNRFYTDEEMCNNLLLSDMCDEYSILGKPNLPQFPVPSGFTEESYLKQLCRDGWSKKIAGNISEYQTKEYVARVLYELDVINGANLNTYFLIVQEFVNWAKNQNWLVGPGRGSAAGCFVSYLTNITTIDPIKHGLIFERFYNAGRNTKDEVAMPDIDCDFPPSKRKYVVQHLVDMYGRECVGQVATFSRLGGKSALKEVLRATTVLSTKEMDEVTASLPNEGQISDKLEEDNEESIIRWTLNNQPKSLERWARLTDNSIDGELGIAFEQAIRIEGVYKSFSKHASAVVLSGSPLSVTMPMIREKNGEELIIGMEYEDAGKMGALKLDILGLNALEKLMDINQLLKFGRVLDEV